MRKVRQQLEAGIHYFGSGTRNSEQFNNFFDLFKRSFTRELKALQATEIEFSKGHFYLSGFFRILNQYYYFSISDVRNNWNCTASMLIRTAEHNRDFTGGANNYVTVQPGMYKKIARTFRIPEEMVTEPTRRKQKTPTEIAEEIFSKGDKVEDRRTMTSMKKANSVAWRLMEKLEIPPMSITTWKYSRGRISHSECKSSGFHFAYYADSKRMVIAFDKDELFKKDI